MLVMVGQETELRRKDEKSRMVTVTNLKLRSIFFFSQQKLSRALGKIMSVVEIRNINYVI
jgi:hypothetical protein